MYTVWTYEYNSVFNYERTQWLFIMYNCKGCLVCFNVVFFSVIGLCKSQESKCTSKAGLPGVQLSRLFLYDHTTTTTNNITFIRLYATQAHGHKPYIQIHNTVINWKKQNVHVHVKTNRKNTTCTDRDTKKKVDYTS